ncbi:ABC transporter permease [Actinospica robiniae]|uniref:ABC transporter permease n=1 Tax=Actinospica robiniae TaxID=304901 RepID=UPI00041618D7|nr:ABC transporter permease [Actinospica robiniae]
MSGTQPLNLEQPAPQAPSAVPLPRAAGSERRPRRYALVRHSLALAHRSLIKTMRTPEALVDVTLQPIIFLALFTYVFGGAIAGAGKQHAYLQFLLPGILAQTIAMGATAIGVNLNTDIEKGVFDRFRSLPIPRAAPLIGAVAADIARYAIVTVVTLATGMAMGFRIETNPLFAIAGCLVAVGFALSLSWVSVWLGMLVRTPGAVQGLMILLVLPLSFGSNTFVSSSTLPGWMQGFVKVNPITQLASTSRGLFLGGPIADPLLWTAVWSVGLVAVFMPLAMRAYRRNA